MKTQKRDVPAGSGGGGKFLKIEIGQSVTGVFRGDPQVYWRKWPKGGVKQEFAVETPGAEERYKVNFVVYEDGEFKVKIFDCNVHVYNQIADINEDDDIETIKCKISRLASGKGSIYQLKPLFKDPISPKALKEIEKLELNQLGGNGQSAPPQQNTSEDDSGSDSLPF